jgi:hypothetical protein
MCWTCGQMWLASGFYNCPRGKIQANNPGRWFTHHIVIYVFCKGFVWTTAENLFACEFGQAKVSCTTGHQVVSCIFCNSSQKLATKICTVARINFLSAVQYLYLVLCAIYVSCTVWNICILYCVQYLYLVLWNICILYCVQYLYLVLC